MSRKTRIAAAATVLGLGGLTGIALSAGGRQANTLADKPLIHTKVIHRTVHVTKHLKSKHPVAGGSAEYAGSTSGSAPIVTASSGASTGETAPVTTASSGTSGGEAAAVTTGPSGTGGGGETGGGEVENEGDGGGD